MPMGEQVSVTPEDLDRLSTTLTSALGGLRGQAKGSPPGEVDAGVSTGVVSETMASIYDSIAKMMADTEQAAGEVTHAGGVYTGTDDQAASELPVPLQPLDGTESSDVPPVPLPPDGGQ